MTNAEYARLRASYAAACESWQRATGAARSVALDRANRLWDEVATEVSLRNIRAMCRAWRRIPTS